MINFSKSKTPRGFSVINFKDRHNNKCSIQNSSLANEDAIWLGIDDPKAQIMANKAHLVGVGTDKKTGFIKYPIPKEVFLTTRMLLTRDDAESLIEILQDFVDSGEI